ncbi:oligosaccharide flippase family protein [Pseudoalteromonas sp. B193]
MDLFYKTTVPNDRIAYKKIYFKRVKEVALIYRDFPLYRAPQQFINALSQSLPILMLASFFGPASAGFYTLAKTVMAIPSTLVGKAVGDVFILE